MNQPGSQNAKYLTYYVHGKEGIELIGGTDGELQDLRWYQIDTYRAWIFGGLIGFLFSIALTGLKVWLNL